MFRTASLATGLLALALAADAAAIPRPEHPEPQAVRGHWANLNGPWSFRFDARGEGVDAKWFEAGAASGFDRTITVPFPWESELSGVHELKGPKVGWYRRTFAVPGDFPKEDHVWLHFGAVDYRADVWVNGRHVAQHEGGYTPFSADITEAVKRDGDNTVVVRAFDPTDPSLPTGKQVYWYTPTSGIWQTVWLESRPKAYIKDFAIRTEIDPARVTVRLTLGGLGDAGEFSVTARQGDTVGEKSVKGAGAADREVALDFTVPEPRLWSPDSPHLYDLNLSLKTPGSRTDEVKTYFSLRTIARGRYGDEPFERVLLNGKPIYLRGALDQSFNPKGIYTAPDDHFLSKDIADAKALGINFLRIHIKPDEPRRLYWADKLGMLIMEDMPNTWQQNPRAREAWEHTMREVVTRDRNHPAIFAWIDFNETWGLGEPARYKQDKDTQDWVRRMVAKTRKIDPTRLVEDNSPCNYDHVEGTDLNSWHFYIDNAAEARRHVAEVVASSRPGSHFNYCPGQEMNSAPLINSEYGSVSAGGGDRDVSWGFRDLTTILRKQPKIQGYIYTELSDIEWEHNGFLNYDRSQKSFEYDYFVPNMTPADLQGADFVGYDAPPAIVAKPGELITVPVFVSHYSSRKDAPTLRWWVAGINGDGRRDAIDPRERPVEWVPYGVKDQKPIQIKLQEPFVGAVALTLVDGKGDTIAANFVNIVVQPEKEAPRVERNNANEVALRFAPEEFSKSRWSGGSAQAPPGKAYGRGKGWLIYRLKVPAAVAKANPDAVEILLEAAAKAGREKVDWPERTNPQDYPQTDERTWPSTMDVAVNGAKIARVQLDDDWADARGVLSHLAGVEHGSRGTIVRLEADLPEAVRKELAAGKPLELTLSVPDDAPHAGGLALYGAHTGAFPFDPTVTLHTTDALPEDLGVPADAPVAVDLAAARRRAILPSGDMPNAPTPAWSYTTTDPGRGWSTPDFNDQDWKRGRPGFGTEGTPGLRVSTRWDTPQIWLRTSIDLPDLKAGDSLTLHVFHDEDVEVLVNGKPLFRARGYVTSYRDVALDDAQKALFHPGRNVIAVTCRQTGGGQGVDVGLGLTRDE